MASRKQNANRQGRTLNKKAAGKKKAEEIINATYKEVKSRSDYAKDRKEGVSDEDYDLGVRVRELRDQGEPWWSIARALELQGYGDSATTGKKGAARARSIYKVAFGDFPRTFKKGGVSLSSRENNEHVAALKKQKKADLRARALGGKPVIDPEMSDEDVAGMLKGRRIKWIVKGDICPEGMELEAAIHPTTPFYIYESNGERVIEFRERHPRAPLEYRMVPAATRTVRVSKIFSVK